VCNTDKGCKKAVWLAFKVKETLGLSGPQVDAEWLCYANAVRPPSMTNCLCRFFSAASTIQRLYAFDNLMLDGDDLRSRRCPCASPLTAENSPLKAKTGVRFPLGAPAKSST